MAQRARVQKYPFIALAFLMSGCFLYFGVKYCAAKMVLSNPISSDGDMSIAKWDVSVDGDENDNLTVVANGATQSYDFTVTNDSDIASKYIITVSNIPANVKVGIDGGVLQTPTDGAVVFENDNYKLDSVNAADHANDHTLNISAALNATAAASQITIDVEFIQEELE